MDRNTPNSTFMKSTPGRPKFRMILKSFKGSTSQVTINFKAGITDSGYSNFNLIVESFGKS